MRDQRAMMIQTPVSPVSTSTTVYLKSVSNVECPRGFRILYAEKIKSGRFKIIVLL